MRHATILVAILAFVPLASATAQEQLRDVRTTTFAAANSVLIFHPGQGGHGPPRWGCRSWDPCLKGAAIGLLVGAGVGGVIALAACTEENLGGLCVTGAIVPLALVGGVIGYAIASSGQHDRLLVSVGPQRDGRYGLGAAVRF